MAIQFSIVSVFWLVNFHYVKTVMVVLLVNYFGVMLLEQFSPGNHILQQCLYSILKIGRHLGICFSSCQDQVSVDLCHITFY